MNAKTCFLGLMIGFGLALAQPPETPPAGAGGPGAGTGAGGAGARTPDPEPKPYDKVITKEAKSDPGIFTVHRIKNRYYYEIPASELGKDFLWVGQIAKTTIGVGYGGQALANHVVRWERKDNRVFLRSVLYEVVADAKLPVAQAVSAANNNAIVMAFNIEAFGKNDAPVIEVTRLFTTDVPELSARVRLRARAFDAQRSFLERVTPYPTNIEVEATHTYTASTDPPAAGPGAPVNPFQPTGMRGATATVVMHYSMVKLPEVPMTPRLFDSRVGYFSLSQMDFGRDEPKATSRRYITRYRLEKKDPSAEMSEPVKPIVYYIDPATPAKWVPYIKKGIEDWQPAFEAAGFRKAILAKEAPTDDPAWAAEDARYSVVRWLPSTIENAVGPHVHDPRSGEILEADIQFYHNVMQLAQDWYFTQTSPNDPRAQKLPLPDDLQGELIRYVVAHEVGHTLGFQHNMKSSSLYTLDQVRNRDWVKENGHVATLMDYSRFNYVAQPEDKIATKDLIPKIGPYDKWATMWGYKPVPGAKSADDEKATLNNWIVSAQDSKPYLRFSTPDSNGSDPGENTEAVGDADPVGATTLGLKNLNRVMSYAMSATAKPGEDFADLDRIYGRILGQWSLEMGHVSQLVGGFDSQEKHTGQSGVRFTIIPRERQMAALKFLGDNALDTPKLFLNAEILRRIEPTGALDRVRQAQMRVLTSLLSSSRLQRMVEQEAMDGAKAYKPAEYLSDLRKLVWKEVYSGSGQIDTYRRGLQRGYLDMIADRLNGPTRVNDDQRPLLRAELKRLSADAASAKATDATTRAHLEDVRDTIAKILDPKLQWTPTPIAAGALRRGFDSLCWPDYGIYLGEPQ